MKYKYIKNPDGTYTIYEVPIFALGNHRGFDYNLAWAQQVVNNNMTQQNTGYLPPVFVGHNDWRNLTEKEANAFLKNIRVDNGVIYADILVMSDENFELISGVKYPYRSIEVWDEEARISGLAILGGTEPYFKFPMLLVDKDSSASYHVYDDGKESFELVNQKPSKPETQKPGPQIFSNAGNSIMKKLDTIISYSTTTQKQPPDESGKDTFNQQQNDHQGGSMLTKEQREEFKKQYGYYPEDGVQALSEIEKYKKQAEDAKVAQFTADLTAAKVTPAALAIIEKAAFKADPDFQALVKDLVKFASEGTLLLPDNDSIRIKNQDGSINYKLYSAQDITDEASELFKAGKFKTYNEAVDSVKLKVRAAK